MFKTEEQFVEHFIATADPSVWTRCAEDAHVRTAYESTCSNGHADWVWGAAFDGWQTQTEAVAEILQKPTASQVLSLLKTGRIRTEAFLERHSGVSRQTFRRSIIELLEFDLIHMPSAGRYLLGSAFQVPWVEICSFEFKLDSWKRAFYQATRYRSFSHRVYVVMPESTFHRAFDHLSAFRQQKVGLISHGTEPDSTKRILISKKGRPRSRSGFIKAVGMLQQQGD